MRRAATSARPVHTAPPLVHEVLRSSGQPLDPAARAFMEPRFGHDFSHVRVHTDARAAESARAVSALAYTVGRTIVFGQGQYSPGSREGRQLLAHELTHVIQQRSQAATAAGPLAVDAGVAHEREADIAAGHVGERNRSDSGVPNIASAGRSALTLQRKPTFDTNCSEWHRCEVMEPLQLAKKMVSSARTELVSVAEGKVTSGRIVDLLNVHFHTPSAQDAHTIHDSFGTIESELNGAIRFNCPPKDPDECTSEKGVVGAFTECSPGADVTICRTYPFFSCPDKAHMLIHEMAHHVPGMCDDHAYVQDAAYMTLPREKSMTNPDTYAQFAEMVYRGPAGCTECSSEVQLRPGQY